MYLTPPLKWFSLEFGIGAGIRKTRIVKTRIMGLPDVQKF